MKRQYTLLLLLGFLSFQVEAGPASPTLYECQGPQGEVLKIFNDGQKIRAEEKSQNSKVAQTWIFDFEQAFTDLPKDPLRLYSTLPELNKPFEWAGQFEFRQQLTGTRNPQIVEVALLRQGKLLKDWQCYQKQGVALVPQLLITPESQAPADLKWASRAVKGVLSLQKLQIESQRMLLLILERYRLWKNEMGEAAWKRQVIQVFEPLLYLAPEMLPGIEKTLSAKTQETFREILKLISFSEFAPLQRWIFWTQLLEKGNWEAVRMGVRGFVNSSYFAEPSLQKFFQKDTSPVFKKAPQDNLNLLLEGLTEKEQDFLKKIWRESKN